MVQESLAPTSEARLAASESTRARRFALPALEDERAGESIEAFLEGPDVRRHRPVARRWRPDAEDESIDGRATQQSVTLDAHTTVATRPAADLRSIPGRLEWTAALERESLRAARYGRPAAVAIVEVTPDAAIAPDRAEADRVMRGLSGRIASALRRDSRVTDLVARVASGRFQVLLPETDEDGAGRYANRASVACRNAIALEGGRASLRVSVAAASPDQSLHEALANALRSIEAA